MLFFVIIVVALVFVFFFFNDTATTEIYTLSLHDALPIWMHNRCRMIVASFLTKDLLLNPQLGEKYFMQRLIDGDLSANNGGWQWSASSGMDPKPVRIFNPASQAQKFDSEGEYIRQWVPELSSMDAEYLVTGKITPLERQAVGYPEPIVEHKQQQKVFKEMYKNQKQKLEALG